MAEEQSIESQDLNLAKLYSDFYIVPNYQREYVWEVEEVEQLFDDILTEFQSADNPNVAEYFIGSLVVCARSDGLIELIDGQQRVTTAYLFLCALRDYLKECGLEPIGALDSQIGAKDVDPDGKDVFRRRVDLQYEDSGEILKWVAEGTVQSHRLAAPTRSIENIKTSYQVISTFLRREFGDDATALRKFYVFFTKNVKLVRIRTRSVAHALKIFETINERGKGLDSMDLLKNLMFMQANQADFERLKTKWKDLVDTLYQANEKPLRFLRYFIFASYDVDRLREEEIYKWFVTNQARCGYQSRPLAFVDELLSAAKAYVNFVNGKDSQGIPNRYLENIRFLSGSARQHLILLLSARHLTASPFSELCRHVENLFFAYTITRENTREFERKFALWARRLRLVGDEVGLEVFLKETFGPEKHNLSERFDFAFANLDSGAVQRYRMRYLLGKLTLFMNEQAYGGAGTEAELKTYVNKKVHVEHILPENPSEEALAEFDNPEQAGFCAQRLGNLCLIEEPYNTSLGNKPYSQKHQVYKRSKFLLTRAIAEQIVGGENTSVDRAVRMLEPFSSWTSGTIKRRQEILGQLARRVWEMPLTLSGKIEVSLHLQGTLSHEAEVKSGSRLATSSEAKTEKSAEASIEQKRKSVGPNPYREGSAIHHIFDVLADGQWHFSSELRQGLDVKVVRRIRSIARRGKSSGNWGIERNGDQFRMVPQVGM